MSAPRRSAASASASAGGGCAGECRSGAATRRDTALMYAACNGHADATCALLIAGAAEGIKDINGYGSRYRASRRGTAPADAACSETAEDYAKQNGKAAAYADAVKRVRLPAHLQAQWHASAACVRVCGV